MGREHGYTRQIAFRCDEETEKWLIRASAGKGAAAGARNAIAWGLEHFRAELQGAESSIAARLRRIANEQNLIAAEVEQLERHCTVIGGSSGAGFLPEPSAELIAQVRQELRPGVIATGAGLLGYGEDLIGNEAVLTVDLANGELAMANTDAEEVKQPLDLPTLASLAGLCSRAVTAAQEQAAQGRSPRKAEPITHRGLGLTVWAAHPDDGHARIQLGGLEQRMHGLVLLQLVAELHALMARATAEQLQIRQGLEKLMAAPDSKAPALAWERSHGEG